MSTDIGKAYEVLGVKPGVPVRELKAAHRDLAKVWHPDHWFTRNTGLSGKHANDLSQRQPAARLLQRAPSAKIERELYANRTGKGLTS